MARPRLSTPCCGRPAPTALMRRSPSGSWTRTSSSASAALPSSRKIRPSPITTRKSISWTRPATVILAARSSAPCAWSMASSCWWTRAKARFRKRATCCRRPSPRSCLLTLVLIWLGIKLVFVQLAIPNRMRDRHPDSNGRLLAEAVPAGETLYLFHVKDECLLFYYGRPAQRLADPLLLPCVLTGRFPRRRCPACQ